MAGRRILLFITLLLLIGVMASAIAPRERQLAPPPTQSEAVPEVPPARVVDGRLPRDKEVRARVGDVVQLSVTHDGRDVAQIVALGLDEPVEAGLPARFVFDADREGRFAVSLRYARERLGVVRVLPAR
jgi:hypothetical protein